MAFTKGQAKSGGRKKGAVNKRTKEFLEILEEQNFCPTRALIRQYRIALKEYKRSAEIMERLLENARHGHEWKPIEDTAPIYMRLMQSAAAELMQYTVPKRKAIEITSKDGGPLDAYLKMTAEEREQRRIELEKRLGKKS